MTVEKETTTHYVAKCEFANDIDLGIDCLEEENDPDLTSIGLFKHFMGSWGWIITHDDKCYCPKCKEHLQITRNAAKCLICEEVIESKHVHDFVTCKCGNLSVDGGLEYVKRSCKSVDGDVLDMCDYEKRIKNEK